MSRNLGTLTLDLVARIDGFNRNMQTATQTVERSVNRMNSAVNTATGTLKHFLALSGTYFSVEGLLHAADGYTEIANKIRLVTDTTAEFKTAMADTFKIAQQTRTSWADTAQVYQRFMQISDSLGLSQERVAKITGTVSKAIAISGTSAVSAQAALMQFGQALGSGVLRGEEFNSVAEQAPALMFALAKGLGVTTAQLRAMANDGKLTGDVLVQSLEKVKDSVDKDFLTAVPTLSSSFTVLSDSLKEFVGSNASGAMGELANGILLVANNLNLIGSAGAAAAIGYITKATIESTAAGYAKVTQTLASIRADQVAVALRQRVAVAEYNAADAELARARASIVAATTDAEMTAALAARTLAVERSAAASMELTAANYALSRSAGVATVATRGLITMLMSPLGLALTVATAAFFYFQDSTKAADDSVSDLTDSIKDLTVKYKELNLAQVQVERGKLTEQMNEASSAIDKARFKFDIYIATQDALFKVSTKSSMALQELSSKVSKGEISTQQAVLEASKFKDITTEQIGKFAQFTQEVDKNNGVISVNKERLSVLNVVSKNKIALTDEQNKQLSVQKTLTDNLTSSYTTHKTSMENVLGSSIEMSRANGNSAQSILYLENILSKYQSGAISATDAAKIFAQSTYIPQSQRDTITDTAKRTDNLKSELNSAEGKLAQMNKQLAAGETAAENQAAAYDKVAQALKGVSKELDKVNADSIAGIQENAFKSKLLAMGKFTQNQIDAMAKVAKAINYNVDLMNTPEFKNAVKLAVSGANLEDKLDTAKDKAKKKDSTAKEQRELLSGARLVGLSGNTGRSTGAHLDIRASGGGRRLTDSDLARFQAGGKQLSAYTKTSEYGSRVHPVTGKRHTHGGIDFKMPVGTPITTKVPIKDITSFYDSKGGGYVQRILFADGLSVDLLHQSEKVKNIKGGSSTGISKLDGMTSKLDNDYAREAEEARKEQARLAKANRDYLASTAQGEAKIWADVNKTIADLSDKGFTGKSLENETARLKKEAQYDVNLYRETQRQKIVEMSKTHRTQQQIIEDEAYLREVTIMAQHDKTEEQRKQEVLANRAGMMEELRLKDIATKHELNSIWSWRKTSSEAIADEWDEKIDAAMNGSDELKDEYIASYKEQKQLALDIDKLNYQQQLLDLQKFNMADIAYFEQTLRIKNDLVDKSNATQAMKDAQKAANNYQNRKDVLGVFKNQPENLDRPMFFGKGAEGQYQEAMYNAAETIRVYSESYATLEQMGLTHSQVMTDLQTAYSEKVRQDNEAIMASERAVAEERFGIMSQVLGMADTVWSSMTDMVKKSFGEQSAAARAMFFVQKGIAAAQAIINTEVAATKAMAEGGFIMGIPMSTAIRTLGYASAGIIAGQGIAGLFGKGFSTGGYTGNMGVNDIAGVVHGKEYVVNARNTVKYRDTLEQMNRGTYKEGSGVNVNIINNAGVPVQQTQDSNGDIRVIIGEELAKQLPQHVNDEYSDFNQHLKRKYHIQRRL